MTARGIKKVYTDAHYVLGAIKDLKSLVNPIDALSNYWVPKAPQWTTSEIQMVIYFYIYTLQQQKKHCKVMIKEYLTYDILSFQRLIPMINLMICNN